MEAKQAQLNSSDVSDGSGGRKNNHKKMVDKSRRGKRRNERATADTREEDLYGPEASEIIGRMEVRMSIRNSCVVIVSPH